MYKGTNLFVYNAWRRLAGMPEVDKLPTEGTFQYNDLMLSEWSSEFERLMRNRLVMGALRYGKIHQKPKPTYDRVQAIFRRLEKYQQTGNTEFLVDIANLALLEFEEGEHPNKHFSSIDDGEHVNVKT